MLFFLLACDSAPSDTAATTTDSADTGSAAALTYYADVKPIMDRTCARCHQVDGLAPSFADPGYVTAIAPTIAAYVAEGRMPPPAPKTECRDYEGSENLTLTAAEKETIAVWAEEGGQLGNEADGTSIPNIPTLAPFDLAIEAGASYAPDFVNVENDYRCFGLELPNDEIAWINGFEPIIGNPAIVHHVVLYTVDAGVELDMSPEGFSCTGFGQTGWEFWLGWAPGAGPMKMPGNTAMRVDARQRVVLNMHYFGNAERVGEADLSGYGFTTQQDEPEHAAIVYPMGTENFVIPADDPEYSDTMRFKWPAGYGKFHVQAVFPHMHLLGRQFEMSVADDCAVDATPWDFHNQVTAFFKEEVVVDEGDQVKVTCTWDNSASSPYQYNDPPQDVRFGEETTNEMCYAFTYGWFEF